MSSKSAIPFGSERNSISFVGLYSTFSGFSTVLSMIVIIGFDTDLIPAK